MYDIFHDESARSLKIHKECDIICQCMLNTGCTIRECEQATGIPKSTVHALIHSYIERFYGSEYTSIVKILEYNKTYRSKPKSAWVQVDAKSILGEDIYNEEKN